MKLASKAQGLSLNVVIIAVIAILVLAVLAFIFIQKTGNFSDGVATCNGQCAFTADECEGAKILTPSCSDDTGVVEGAKYCCIG
jgi:hypothetical protein